MNTCTEKIIQTSREREKCMHQKLSENAMFLMLVYIWISRSEHTEISNKQKTIQESHNIVTVVITIHTIHYTLHGNNKIWNRSSVWVFRTENTQNIITTITSITKFILIFMYTWNVSNELEEHNKANIQRKAWHSYTLRNTASILYWFELIFFSNVDVWFLYFYITLFIGFYTFSCILVRINVFLSPSSQFLCSCI